MTHGYLWLIIGFSDALRSDAACQVEKHETESATDGSTRTHCCYLKIKTSTCMLMDIPNRHWWTLVQVYLWPCIKSIKVLTALDEQSRVMGTPTSTTDMIVVVRGGIVVVLTETFGGSSSLRLVLYWSVIGQISQHQSYVHMATWYILSWLV